MVLIADSTPGSVSDAANWATRRATAAATRLGRRVSNSSTSGLKSEEPCTARTARGANPAEVCTRAATNRGHQGRRSGLDPKLALAFPRTLTPSRKEEPPELPPLPPAWLPRPAAASVLHRRSCEGPPQGAQRHAQPGSQRPRSRTPLTRSAPSEPVPRHQVHFCTQGCHHDLAHRSSNPSPNPSPCAAPVPRPRVQVGQQRRQAPHHVVGPLLHVDGDAHGDLGRRCGVGGRAGARQHHRVGHACVPPGHVHARSTAHGRLQRRRRRCRRRAQRTAANARQRDGNGDARGERRGRRAAQRPA